MMRRGDGLPPIASILPLLIVVKSRESYGELVFELFGTTILSLKRAAIQAVDFGDRMPNGTEEQERRSRLMHADSKPVRNRRPNQKRSPSQPPLASSSRKFQSKLHVRTIDKVYSLLFILHPSCLP
jgi:hypothetical protein